MKLKFLIALMAFVVQSQAQLYLSAGSVLYIDNGATVSMNNGDVTLNANITGAGTGKLVMLGTALQNIYSNGYKVFGLEVNNTNNVRLNQSTEVNGILTLTNGSLEVNNNILTLSGTTSFTSGSIAGSALSELVIAGVAGGSLGTVNIATGGTNNLFKNLTVNRTGVASNATLGKTLVVSNLVTLTSGILNTGGYLVLQSNATSTAAIAPVTGAIAGNVIAQRFIPSGRRAFRFIGHPFSNALALNQLLANVDITGAGGASNGFTPTVSNAPSAFWYDVVSGNGSTTNDIGWTAFTNTNGIGSNAWSQYKTARVLIRGALGEGLNGIGYTPSTITLNTVGTVNTGNQNIPLIKSAGSGYNILANPYPSQIDVIPALQAATNIGTAFWIWDANQALKGGYTSSPIATTPNYILPMHGSIIVNALANTSLNFTESNKTTTTPINLFRTSGFGTNFIELRLETDSIFWDRILLFFNDKTLANKDKNDAEKLTNSEVNFYTLSQDDQKLSIDTRPYKPEQAIPVALLSNAARSYTIRTTNFDIPANTSLFLHDKYLQKWEALNKDAQYNFVVTADSLSQGANRFEIVQKQQTVLPTATVSIKISPNPVKDIATLTYTLAQQSNIAINLFSATGQLVHSVNLGNQQTGLYNIAMQQMAAGVYVVVFKYGNETKTIKLVKE